MRRRHLLSLALLCSLGSLAPARAAETVHDRLTGLAQEMIDTTARLQPMLATALGTPGHDADLETPTEAGRTAELGQVQKWRDRLHRIATSSPSKLSLVDANDVRLLQAQLDRARNELVVYQTDRKNYGGAALRLVQTIYTQLHELPVAGRDGATPEQVSAAWNDIIERLASTPAFLVAAQRLVTTPGHLYGMVGSRQLAGAPDLF